MIVGVQTIFSCYYDEKVTRKVAYHLLIRLCIIIIVSNCTCVKSYVNLFGPFFVSIHEMFYNILYLNKNKFII